MKFKECKICKNKTFLIEHREKCRECNCNGAYSEEAEEYIYDEHEIKQQNLDRDEVQENSQCKLGAAWDNGCEVFTCSKCEDSSCNIAWTDWG